MAKWGQALCKAPVFPKLPKKKKKKQFSERGDDCITTYHLHTGTTLSFESRAYNLSSKTVLFQNHLDIHKNISSEESSKNV